MGIPQVRQPDCRKNTVSARETDFKLGQKGEAAMSRVTRTIRVGRGRAFRIILETEQEDDYARGLLHRNFWLRHEWNLLSRFLPKTGGRFLDLGGHLGSFALTAAAFGHEVVVVEASPTNADLIRASARANGFDHATVVHAAVYREQRSMRFVENGPYGFLIEHDDPNLPVVPGLPVSEILDRCGWERVDLVKMDIEGSEIWAVDGMAPLLSRSDAPAIFYECNSRTLHDFGRSSCHELRARLESFGYSSFEYADERTPLQPVSSAEPQPDLVRNCLAVKLASNPLRPCTAWTRSIGNRVRGWFGRKPIMSWLRGWPVGFPATEKDWIANFRRAIAEAAAPIYDEHLCRELEVAPDYVRADPIIRDYLARMQKASAKAA